jgi:hypothetical protein
VASFKVGRAAYIPLNTAGIEKDPRTGDERNAMLVQIGRGFGFVPFKITGLKHTGIPYKYQLKNHSSNSINIIPRSLQ